jgi:hypothetical protein
MRAAVLSLAMLSASSAHGDEPLTYYSNEGDEYLAVINENGAVLTSRYPKSWFHGEPTEDHEVHTESAEIYFGNNCDAMHNEYGLGTWSGGNGAFGARFGDHLIHFGRQELFGDQFDKCYVVSK